MKNSLCKISVIIICYNQEDVISRSIESVLKQSNYVHELIISDDASSDNTWSIIEAYKLSYADKIKAMRNSLNIGMYENLQNAFKFITGNLILFLAGDDEFGLELFSKIHHVVQTHSLNPELDSFSILTDYALKHTDGTLSNFTNNKLTSGLNPFSLKLRGLVVGRALCESKIVFLNRQKNFISRVNKIFPSALQEGYTDAFPFAFSDKIIYLPYCGNIYYTSIGHLKKIEHIKIDLLSRYENYAHDFKNIFISKLSKHDIVYLDFIDAKYKYLIEPNFGSWFKYFRSLLSLFYDPLVFYFIKKEIFYFFKVTYRPSTF